MKRIYLISLLLLVGTAARAHADKPALASPATVKGKVELPLNGLSFVLSPSEKWTQETQFSTATTHSTYRHYVSRETGRSLEISIKNTVSPAADIESVTNEYQNQIFSRGLLNLISFRRGFIDILPAGFFEVQIKEGPAQNTLVAITVLHGQSYHFVMGTPTANPAADRPFKNFLASIKISRDRPGESRVQVPTERQAPDQIIGNPRIEAELESKDPWVKAFTTRAAVIARLGPPEIIMSKEGKDTFAYTFSRFNYLNQTGTFYRYEIMFSPDGTFDKLRITTTRVTEPFLEIGLPPVDEPTPPSKPKRSF